jgi:hypothetical protein
MILNENLQTYKALHARCEACGAFLVDYTPHHIKSRGAGGKDNHGNLLALCIQDHRLIHDKGDREFTKIYPHLLRKIALVKVKQFQKKI